ncbi:MAG: hypothetical protein DK841_06605 [Candidatus Melainabacteria bacterium]|jgi:hypothetical protein|nr:MAG: hypothetical protein DK841_06605 [Candidatus Melainabacteria bacterium]
MRDSIGIFDRIISFLSYITAGWGGMIVLVVMYFRKKTPSHFLRYNAMQSIFISLLYFIIAMGLGLILKFLSYIPFINYLVAQIAFFFNRPLLLDYSLIQLFTTCLIAYLAISSLLGIYPRVYWISKNIIDRNV